MEYSEYSEVNGGNAGTPLVKERSTYMTDVEAEKMCKLFADGLDSGIGYDRIFEFMERQKFDKKLITQLRSSIVDYGDQLGEAFTRLGLLDAVSRKVLLVAEEQGELVPTFREQGRNFGARDKRRRKIGYAFVPSIVLIGFSLILWELVLVIRFGVTQGTTWEILAPAIGVGVMKGLSIIAIISIAIWSWFQVPVDLSLRDASSRFFLNIPVVSKPLAYRSLANFCRYLRQSLRAGMDMSRCIELAAEGSNNPKMTRHIDASIEAIKVGYSLEQALTVMKGIDRETLDYIAIGEETGKLEENLAFLTQKFDTLANESSERVVAFFNSSLLYSVIIATFIMVFWFGLYPLFGDLFGGALGGL